MKTETVVNWWQHTQLQAGNSKIPTSPKKTEHNLTTAAWTQSAGTSVISPITSVPHSTPTLPETEILHSNPQPPLNLTPSKLFHSGKALNVSPQRPAAQEPRVSSFLHTQRPRLTLLMSMVSKANCRSLSLRSRLLSEAEATPPLPVLPPGRCWKSMMGTSVLQLLREKVWKDEEKQCEW